MESVLGIIAAIITIVLTVFSIYRARKRVLFFFKSTFCRAKNGYLETIQCHARVNNDVYALKLRDAPSGVNASIVLDFGGDGIKFNNYDTELTPLYAFTSYPVRLLLPLPIEKGLIWSESGGSNNAFNIHAVSEVVSDCEKVETPAGGFECIRVDTVFTVPESYTGPKYKKKSVWWNHGVGPVQMKMEFHDSGPSIASLVDFDVKSRDTFWPMLTDNWWTYSWEYSRPNNNKNVSAIHNEVNTRLVRGEEGK